MIVVSSFCISGCNIAEKSDHKFYLNISRTRQHIKNELVCSKLLTFDIL